jgi:anthranilate phosphoribosyltransferase
MLKQVVFGEATERDIRQLMTLLMRGDLSQAEIGAFLAALSCLRLDHKPDILAVCADIMASAALSIPLKFDRSHFQIADIVGTGGDGHNTFNASTTAGLVLAGVSKLYNLPLLTAKVTFKSACLAPDLG